MHPTCNQNCVFYVISQQIGKKFGEKVGDQVYFDEIDHFTDIFSCMYVTSSIITENSAAMQDWRKTVLMNLHLYFFPETL